jgi:hypothetical protein
MDVSKNEIELVSFFIKEIKKELESKSEIGFIPEEELNFTTKQILSMLAKSTVNKYMEY